MNPTANESLHFHMENSNNPQKIDILMKKNCQDLLKTQSEKLAMKKYGDVYFYACVCLSFIFRHKFYGRRVFKRIMQDDLLRPVYLCFHHYVTPSE